MIEAMLAKQEKIAARKQLYFSLSLLVLTAGKHISMLAQGVAAIQENLRNDDLPEGIDKEKLTKVAISEQLSAIRPVFCLCNSLKSYKHAFGEYPEFVRFVVNDDNDAAVDKMIEQGLQLVTDAKRLMKKGGISLELNGKTLESAMYGFGDEFVKRCDAIKLKGEK